jgi:hypothetical protein
VCVDDFFPIPIKRQKHFSAKSFSGKTFGGDFFFQILE